MGFGQDAGKGAIEELGPELKAVIDHFFQRLDEFVQKYAKLLADNTKAPSN